jgi:cell wall-associated NlpC family hydrolase
MEQKFAMCRVAVAPLRTAASDAAEIATQLLFGDQVEILERAEPWYRIRNAFDHYEGWMDFKQLSAISEEDYKASQQLAYLAPPAIYNPIEAADGSLYYLPASCSLPFYKDGYCRVGTEKFKVLFEPYAISAAAEQDLTALSLFYKNAPYLWGGRTMFGIDCSGFSQAVLKMLGVNILRDAAQQAQQGETVNFLPQVKPGDLAFFDNAAGKIIHVGIILGPGKIIHASGRIKIDTINDQGIYSAELGRYSHQLRIIKRFAVPSSIQ